MTPTRSQHPNRQGAAVVEFAVVLPLLFLLAMGMAEASLGFVTSQVTLNAAREGARAAARENTTYADVSAVVQRYLAANNIQPGQFSVTVTPPRPEYATAGDQVEVQVVVNASARFTFFRNQQNVTEKAVMLKSGTVTYDFD